MPSRRTATLTTTTTTTKTNATRKTAKTSAYFTRSVATSKKNTEKKQVLHRDKESHKDEKGEEEEGSDEQTHIVTGLDFLSEDALARTKERERDDGDGDIVQGDKALTEAQNNNPDNGLAAANESIQTATLLSTDITDTQNTKTKRCKSTSPRKKPLPPLPKLSPYFPKPLPLIDASCLPFPPISAASFGLIQEQLCHQPFRLLIATIFLNRTRGPVAIPVLFQLFEKYPTIRAMAHANHADIVTLIRGLGFQNQRATKFIALAQKWLSSPPAATKRYRKLHYPNKKDGADIGADEVIGADDARVGWEIAHLPGVGAYAIDSWRIFCRDILLLADEPALATTVIPTQEEPEWKKVLPQDKELRAYLTWMWLKEGWLWDPETGNRTRADAGMMERAQKGGVAYEAPNGDWVLEASENNETHRQHDGQVKKAGFGLDCS